MRTLAVILLASLPVVAAAPSAAQHWVHCSAQNETCDLDGSHPAVAALDAKIIELTGLDPAYGEPLQGQRYAVGQQFKAHHDFFHPGEPYWPEMQRTGGQRTWTAKVFLIVRPMVTAGLAKLVDDVNQYAAPM